jgi:hypothetical protein
MAEIPSRFVAHIKGALELVGANSLLGFYNEVDGKKPFPQREMGVMEDGVSGDRKLVAA